MGSTMAMQKPDNLLVLVPSRDCSGSLAWAIAGSTSNMQQPGLCVKSYPTLTVALSACLHVTAACGHVSAGVCGSLGRSWMRPLP